MSASEIVDNVEFALLNPEAKIKSGTERKTTKNDNKRSLKFFEGLARVSVGLYCPPRHSLSGLYVVLHWKLLC